jgi:uncharacterized membrane protein
LFLYVAGAIFNFVTGIVFNIPLLGWLLGIILSPVFWIGGFILFATKLFLMYKAYTGATFKLPILGDVVSGQIFK